MGRFSFDLYNEIGPVQLKEERPQVTRKVGNEHGFFRYHCVSPP